MYTFNPKICSKLYFSDGSTSDTSASVIQAIPFQARNYYKSVSENKEIVKLVSVLSTSISSTKKVHALLISNKKISLKHIICIEFDKHVQKEKQIKEVYKYFPNLSESKQNCMLFFPKL